MKRTNFLVIAMLFTASLLHAQTTPLQLNNEIAKISDSLFSQGKKWGAAFNEAYKDGSYSRLKPISDALLTFLNEKTIYVEKLKDVKNSKPLRMAMIDFLTFEKEMLNNNFKPFELLDASTPKDKIQAAVTSLLEKAKEEDDYLRKLTDKQNVYAGENGFVIEPKQ